MKEKGITLISLIITIILLLILTSVVLNLSLGDNSIFRLATNASKNYLNIQNKELSDLEELYSQIKIATNSEVTLTTEQLNEYINEKLDEKLKSTIGQIRSGHVIFGSINKSTGKVINVTFKEPMENDNYSVTVTNVNGAKHYALTEWSISGKTANGFIIYGYNTMSEATGNLEIDYIAIPYTE